MGKKQDITVKVYINRNGQKVPLEEIEEAERLKIARDLNIKALRALGYEVTA